MERISLGQHLIDCDRRTSLAPDALRGVIERCAQACAGIAAIIARGALGDVLGSAGGPRKAAGLLASSTFLIVNGDTLTDLDIAALPKSAMVYDIVYVPLMTELLKAAQQRGNPIVDGIGMLLHQAVPGFKAWFADPAWALPAAIAVETWHGFPFFGLLLLAGLKGVPQELYEAAAVDGLGPGNLGGAGDLHGFLRFGRVAGGAALVAGIFSISLNRSNTASLSVRLGMRSTRMRHCCRAASICPSCRG